MKAVEALQKAFTRNRYILRTLPRGADSTRRGGSRAHSTT